MEFTTNLFTFTRGWQNSNSEVLDNNRTAMTTATCVVRTCAKLMFWSLRTELLICKTGPVTITAIWNVPEGSEKDTFMVEFVKRSLLIDHMKLEGAENIEIMSVLQPSFWCPKPNLPELNSCLK